MWIPSGRFKFSEHDGISAGLVDRKQFDCGASDVNVFPTGCFISGNESKAGQGSFYALI